MQCLLQIAQSSSKNQWGCGSLMMIVACEATNHGSIAKETRISNRDQVQILGEFYGIVPPYHDSLANESACDHWLTP